MEVKGPGAGSYGYEMVSENQNHQEPEGGQQPNFAWLASDPVQYFSTQKIQAGRVHPQVVLKS
jgi:hypothetical protein